MDIDMAESEIKLKHNIKDTVFRDLFSEPKYLLKMYQALHPEDASATESDLEIVTLQSIFANGIYNDLGFLVRDRLMIMVEAQSTWSPNIVIRALMYLVTTYQRYFIEKKANLYGHKLVHMPKPEIYVIYTGPKGNHPAELSLQEMFFPGQDCCINVTAKMIYLSDKDDIITQYINFCNILNQQIAEYGPRITAIKNTIRICRDKNLLKEYLENRAAEVENIMMTLFDQEEVMDIYLYNYGEEKKAEGEAIGEARGEARGRSAGKLEALRDAIRDGITTLSAIKATGRYSEKELALISAPQ